MIPEKARYAYVLKYHHLTFLIYSGQLCGYGCTAIREKNPCSQRYSSSFIRGKNQIDGLWDILLTAPVLSPSTIQLFQSRVNDTVWSGKPCHSTCRYGLHLSQTVSLNVSTRFARINRVQTVSLKPCHVS